MGSNKIEGSLIQIDIFRDDRAPFKCFAQRPRPRCLFFATAKTVTKAALFATSVDRFAHCIRQTK